MKLFKIGKVQKAHGFRGSFTVSTSTGKNSILRTATQLYVGSDEAHVTCFQVTEAAWMPKAWKITVNEIKSDEEVKALRGLSVFVERDLLPQPKTGEYYVSDLMGLEGIDRLNQIKIGIFSDFHELALAKTNVIQHTWIFTNSLGKSLQVPAVPHFIFSVDLLNKKIYLKNLQELEWE